MITKQQQLEWLAENYHDFNEHQLLMSINALGKSAFDADYQDFHLVTKKEWQQERDKMSSKPEVDNSWYEREEVPPYGVPVELWWGGSFAYNCEFITRRGHHYVMWNLDADRPDAADYMNSEFRPLRTEREKAIDEMVSLVRDGLVSHEMAKEFAIKMFDAGYRKVKP